MNQYVSPTSLMSRFVSGGGIIARPSATFPANPVPKLGLLPTALACGRPELVLLAVKDGESMPEACDDEGV